jgi:hypothetical protein
LGKETTNVFPFRMGRNGSSCCSPDLGHGQAQLRAISPDNCNGQAFPYAPLKRDTKALSSAEEGQPKLASTLVKPPTAPRASDIACFPSSYYQPKYHDIPFKIVISRKVEALIPRQIKEEGSYITGEYSPPSISNTFTCLTSGVTQKLPTRLQHFLHPPRTAFPPRYSRAQGM